MHIWRGRQNWIRRGGFRNHFVLFLILFITFSAFAGFFLRNESGKAFAKFLSSLSEDL